MSKYSSPPITKLSIDLGTLGKIEVVQINEEVLEVFAKEPDSSNMVGPNFSDDCNLNPPLCAPAVTA